MKRILLPAVILTISLVFFSNVYGYYGSYSSCRPRYSPYAFSYYHRSGLVPGGLYYSPYAFGYGRTGLIPDYVQYHPYAFSYESRGLVANVCYGIYGDCYGPGISDSSVFYKTTSAEQSQSKMKFQNSVQANYFDIPERNINSNRITRPSRQVVYSGQTNNPEANRPDRIILNYLKSKEIDFQMNRLVRIDSRTLSVDFILSSENMLIKYTSPDDISLIEQQGGYKSTLYKNCARRYSDFSEEYCKNGGNIYLIETSDPQEILEKLKLCKSLNNG